MNNPAFCEEQKRIYRSKCRAMGLRITTQRMATFDFLVSSVTHPTTEEIHLGVRNNLPHISVTSIYKILGEFHKLGVIRKVPTKNNTMRYEANISPHHHLICTRCDGIWDLPMNDFEIPSLPEYKAMGFHVFHSEICFYGRCTDCN